MRVRPRARCYNPGKVFPTLSPCIEQGHLHVRGAELPHPFRQSAAASDDQGLANETAVVAFVREARDAAKTPFEIMAGGTIAAPSGFPRRRRLPQVLDVSGLSTAL